MQDLINELKSHDYYHEYSDDISVQRRGSFSESDLIGKLAAMQLNNALILVERYVPKMYQERFAYLTTVNHRRITNELQTQAIRNSGNRT
jgi:hypothetical protein